LTDYAVVTFRDLQDAALENRFRDTVTNRNRAKKLLNTRYQQLVGMEDWPFRYKTGTFTSSIGSNALSSPTDFGAILNLQDSQGNQIPFVPQDLWVASYALDPVSSVGPAQAFTTIGGVLNVSPKAGAVENLTGLYRAVPALMQNDSDTPSLIPQGHRYVLVHGARAEMLQDMQDPAWRDEETLWQGAVQAMQRDLLVESVGGSQVWPSDPTW
jgi:hypothetical protein